MFSRILRFFLPFTLLWGLASCRRSNPSESYSARIGVAVQLPNRLCMAILNRKLLPGAAITLLAPADIAQNIPVASARAQVLSGTAGACPGSSPDSGITSYNLQITTGAVRPNAPMIALDARVPSVMAAHSFHACNGSDGVQLTAWDGAKPLEGHRLWHQYYDLGQKLNATCTGAETAAY